MVPRGRGSPALPRPARRASALCGHPQTVYLLLQEQHIRLPAGRLLAERLQPVSALLAAGASGSPWLPLRQVQAFLFTTPALWISPTPASPSSPESQPSGLAKGLGARSGPPPGSTLQSPPPALLPPHLLPFPPLPPPGLEPSLLVQAVRWGFNQPRACPPGPF